MPNRQINELFWAFVIAIVLASSLAALGFILTRPDNATQAIFRIADSLVTGALGFFAGRALALKPTEAQKPEEKQP